MSTEQGRNKTGAWQTQNASRAGASRAHIGYRTEAERMHECGWRVSDEMFDLVGARWSSRYDRRPTRGHMYPAVVTGPRRTETIIVFMIVFVMDRVQILVVRVRNLSAHNANHKCTCWLPFRQSSRK